MFEVLNRIYLVQYRDHWQARVIIKMTFRFSRKLGILLTSWATVSYLRRALLRGIGSSNVLRLLQVVISADFAACISLLSSHVEGNFAAAKHWKRDSVRVRVLHFCRHPRYADAVRSCMRKPRLLVHVSPASWLEFLSVVPSYTGCFLRSRFLLNWVQNPTFY